MSAAVSEIPFGAEVIDTAARKSPTLSENSGEKLLNDEPSLSGKRCLATVGTNAKTPSVIALGVGNFRFIRLKGAQLVNYCVVC